MKKKLLSILLLASATLISYQSLTYSSGPPESYSNAPGEGNCANPGCHGGSAILTGAIWDSISLSVVGNTLSGLLADSTYTFELHFANPASVRYGFQLCVLASGASASTPSLGTLTNTSTETQLVSSPDRTYLEHTSSGTSAPSNSKTWSFDWTVPSAYSGGAVFYVVINSTNNDGTNSGDIIYAKTFTANVSLPVSWLSVNAVRKELDVQLEWSTASEMESDKYVIERSADRNHWEAIGEVKAIGTSAIKTEYRFTDSRMMKSAYYRIKQMDVNGAFSYSKIVYSSEATWKNTILFNNQTHELINGNGMIGNIELYNQRGQQVWKINCTQSSVKVPQFPAGIYFLQCGNELKKLIL